MVSSSSVVVFGSELSGCWFAHFVGWHLGQIVRFGGNDMFGSLHHMNLNESKSQVDSLADRLRRFRHLVNPIVLSRPAHHEKAPVREFDFGPKFFV